MRRLLTSALFLLFGVTAAFAQLGGGSGSFNLYTLNDYATSQFQNITGRVVAAAPAAAGTGVFILAGQSLIANEGVTTYTPTNTAACLNLNIYDGVVYQLKDPTLGTTGTAGSYIGRLCDKLVNAGKYTKVLMVPIAIGGTTVGQWTSGGEAGLMGAGGNSGWFSHRLIVALNRVRQQGLTPTAVLWDQGTQDAANGTTSVNYQTRFNNLVTTMQGSSYTGKWAIAKDTMVANVVSATIQAAQAAVVNGTTVYAGADIDSLTGGTNRQADGTHLTDTGNDSAATLWSTMIQATF
jgi:hypothetical protein